ncbi:MAG: phosphoribosylaminoimidazolesuccinocarboxamide synthase [Thermoplasmata archaeon]|nr:MAG: phosphoribosylaminoimidazolesuccinocarboxamide synthase [Thermoplasmata archaeon]
MKIPKGEELHSGKAKTVYEWDEDHVLVEFRDDLTAFDAEKKATEAGKGRVNCEISAKMFNLMTEYGIENHFVRLVSETEMICRKVDIVMLEVIVRNYATGSLVRRYPFEEGLKLDHPIVNMDLKNDAYHDPLVNTDIALALGLANLQEQREMREMGLRVNEILVPYFDELGLILVDFKIEVGRYKGRLILADEISPDTMRLWDKETGRSLDKDVFRFDKGDVMETYQIIHKMIMEK